MSSAGTVLTSKILARHGARPDCRLWRNERGVFYAPDFVSRVTCGLCNGAADIIGLKTFRAQGGYEEKYARFVAIEVKAKGDRMKPHQRAFLDMIAAMGGIGVVATCVEDVDAALGAP